jgi:hypothetical protein
LLLSTRLYVRSDNVAKHRMGGMTRDSNQIYACILRMIILLIGMVTTGIIPAWARYEHTFVYMVSTHIVHVKL